MGFVEKAEVFDDTFDCIVGLAFKKMAAKGTVPIMDNIIDEGVLMRNIFSFFLSQGDEDHDAGLNSKLVFGKIDQSDIVGNITWFDVVDKDFWALPLTDILLDNQSLGLCNDKTCLITPDSGTSCLTMPTWARDKVKHLMPEDEPCESDTDFQTLTFEILDVDGVPRRFNLESERYIAISDEDKSRPTCTSVVAPLDIRQKGLQNLFILGDIFMTKFKCYFDRDTDQVGIALAKHADAF